MSEQNAEIEPFYVSAGVEQALAEAARTGRDINIAGALYRKVNHGAPAYVQAQIEGSRPDLLSALSRAVDAARSNTFVCGHPWSGRGPHCVNSTCVHHPSNCANHADRLNRPAEPLPATCRECGGPHLGSCPDVPDDHLAGTFPGTWSDRVTRPGGPT